MPYSVLRSLARYLSLFFTFFILTLWSAGTLKYTNNNNNNNYYYSCLCFLCLYVTYFKCTFWSLIKVLNIVHWHTQTHSHTHTNEHMRTNWSFLYISIMLIIADTHKKLFFLLFNNWMYEISKYIFYGCNINTHLLLSLVIIDFYFCVALLKPAKRNLLDGRKRILFYP